VQSMQIRKLARFLAVLLVIGVMATAASAQTEPPGTSSVPTTYQPKFPGDPARSESESSALGYMRVVVRAQKEYKKRHDHYATTLADLVNNGSFTKRMAKTTERGDYSVGFKSKKDGYSLTMTPKNLDAQHRSFYADEDGVIHGDETKPADESSPKVK
jgi:hypothetical protein